SGDEGALPIWSALVNFCIADIPLDEADCSCCVAKPRPTNSACSTYVETGRDATAAAAPAPTAAPQQAVSLDAADVMLADQARADNIAFTTR
ncbi:hypothetical protein HK405_013036, partial [Cladochytrium tenue]